MGGHSYLHGVKSTRICLALIKGLEPQQDLALIWVTNTDPNKPRTRKITREERAVGFLQLGDDPTWRGQILQFGLLVPGKLPEPVLLKGLTLEREAPTPMSDLRSLAGDWTHQEPWTGRSINFHVGAAAKDRLLTPVLLVGLWVGLGSLLLVIFNRFSSSDYLSLRVRYHLLPYRVFAADHLPTPEQVQAGVALAGQRTCYLALQARIFSNSSATEFSAMSRSYPDCRFIQNCGVVLKNRPRRSAVSAVMARLPFRMSLTHVWGMWVV